MSERIVDDPSLHGWVEEDGKWVWGGQPSGTGIEDGDTEGQITTWSGSEWTPESAVVVSGGNVGIGMAPTRSTAKEQLAEWKTRFDARLKAEPKADKKAVTLEITDDAFEVMPTEEALAAWMETRGAGDRLQVGGNISASGIVYVGESSQGRLQEADDEFRVGSMGSLVFRTGGYSSVNSDRLTIDATGNATFSGKVLATNMGSESNSCGIRFQAASETASTRILPTDTDSIADGEIDLGNASGRFKNGFFSGTVNANKFVGDGSGLTGVGGGLPDGDFTHNGKITATDFIATSDERVKDNITTAPVGLIDSLKGREWDWKESGEKGSGVVAQELEQVLPHLVHEDDDGMKSVSYTGLCAYLIEEVKALRAEVEALKS